MIKKLLVAWLFISLCTQASGQETYKIHGLVIDAANMSPIEGANIIGNPFFAISSENGKFTIENIPQGNYDFKVSHVAYTSQTVTVEVFKNLDGVVIQLQPTVTNLDEVELLGKSEKRKAQELSTITVGVTKEFLESNRENSLMQTLRKIPGVSTLTIGSGQSKPVIRGLGFNRVSVVQNGIKHEAQQWGNDHGLEIDQYGIEDIQIIKGPASLLYGSDAIAGVVDIQPPKIPEPNAFGGEVNLLGETNNDLLGLSAGIQGRLQNWFYRGRLTYRDYGDYKVPTDQINYESYIFELHENHLRNTAGSEANAGFSIGYVKDHVKSETFISNVNAKNGFFANAHGLEVRTSTIDYDSSDRDVDLPYHKVNHFKATNNTTFYIGNHTLDFDLGYQNNQREERSEPVPHGYMPTPPNSRERIFTKNTYSLNAKDTYSPHEKHDLSFGINTELQNNNIGGWGFLIPEYNRYSAGAFVYDHFKIQENLHLQSGIRYDVGLMRTKAYFDWFRSPVNNRDGTTSYVYLQRAQDRDIYFGNFSGSIGMSYLTKNTTCKINLGKSFRMPLANELASDGVNYHMYRFERGNLDLDAEQSYQLDLDIDYTTERFNAGISPFLNYFGNFIYLNPTANYYETLQIYEYTQSEVLRYGGEVWAGMDITTALRLDASVEYIYARQTSGPKKDFTIPFTPPLSTLFSASYRFKDFLFFQAPLIMVDFRVTAAQNNIVPPEVKTEGYQALNLSANTKIQLFEQGSPAQLRIKLNNVLNTKFYDHTSFYRLIDVPEPGRNLSVSLTIPF
ncbi:TonB-dependent receptor [Maribacter cobaltidurans]|uniref:TonB-dependent receptor n=1 Tax=Maribacter cobaltidurans TaxID=1178778 RepID=A0A223V6C3_9FLAO|nr:TonB-dependent receptor [Maribacter cobaltidurans]ASV30747.1 TonB-dependent receptor [Maribacter cobaltidurans]GGD81456.1 TonB-dependent receptor [Maribacter cobaltidurans]